MKRLTRSIEEITKQEVLASVLFVENGRFVRHGAAPSLPAAYTKAVDGAPIGPNAGSCGTAAWRRESVYVIDLETDPPRADYPHRVAGLRLHASCTPPILAPSGGVAGPISPSPTSD